MSELNLPFDLDKFFAECVDISKVKSQGYASGKAACFNFVVVELLTGIPAWQAVACVRLVDKNCRNVSFATKAAMVKDDSLEDCCRDTANYAGIELWLYRHAIEITGICHAFRFGLALLETEVKTKKGKR